MNISLATLLLALAAQAPAADGGTPQAAAAEAPAPQHVVVEVDHRGLLKQQAPKAADWSRDFVRDDIEKALQEQPGVALANDDTATKLLVKLDWVSYEDSVYQIEVSLVRSGGQAEAVASWEAYCHNNSALSAEVMTKLPEALEQLAHKPKTEPASTPASEPSTEPKATASTEPSTADDRPPRRPLRTSGKVGVGLLALGTVALISGGIVFAQGESEDARPPDAEWRTQNFQPPGVGVMVTGGVLLATGAVLLIVDRVRARRGRANAKSRAKPTAAQHAPLRPNFGAVGRF